MDKLLDKVLDTSQVISGIAVLLSFYVGYKYALKKDASSKTPKAKQSTEDMEIQSTSDILSSLHQNYKMVLVVRNDLKMGKGKIGAQCGHGAVGAYQKAMKYTPSLVRAWENTGCAKVALKVESEHELMDIKRAADSKQFTTCLIRDAGRTQIAADSKTVLAIGPAPVEAIDRVTGHLKLL